jgi:hypothetical protein
MPAMNDSKDEDENDLMPRIRRTPRKAQKIMPKHDYADFLDEDDDFDMPDFSPKLVSRPRVEIPAMGSKSR